MASGFYFGGRWRIKGAWDWGLEAGDWRLEVGGWRLEVAGSEAASLEVGRFAVSGRARER